GPRGGLLPAADPGPGVGPALRRADQDPGRACGLAAPEAGASGLDPHPARRRLPAGGAHPARGGAGGTGVTRRLLLSYLSLATLVLLCLEVPLGFIYSRAEREQVVNSA